MINALKMTADRIAETGWQVHHVQRVQLRISRCERRRDDGEILRDVVGDAERGERAARHQHLLAGLHHLDELGGVRVEIDHVAGFLGRLGTGVHRHRHIGLRERRRIVRAIARHGDQAALRLVLTDEAQLRFRRGLGEKVVDTRFGGDGGGRERLYP